MQNFKSWLYLREDANNSQLPNPPKTKLQQYYVDQLNQWFLPKTVLELNKNSNFYDPSYMYKQIVDGIYKSIRKPNEKEGEHYNDVPHDMDIDKVTAKPTNLVQVKDENGWHYRMPYSFSKHPRANFRIPKNVEEGRISIAALANDQLIQTLDEYVAKKRLAYYKTPTSSDQWTERHDPITMYFKEPVTPEIKAELAQIMNNKNFNRAMFKPNPLTGDKFATGLAYETSANDERIQKEIQKFNQISPQAAQAVKNFLTSKDGKLKASAGQMLTLDKFEKVLKQIPNTPQQPPNTPQQPPNKNQQTNTPQQNQPFSVSSLANKVGDVNWHTVYDAFARQIKKNPKSQEAQKIGKALYQAATTNDMSHIRDYVNQYARAKRI
jgi:hypothetical protein